MEKVVYAVWADPGEDREAFAERLRGPVARRLLDAGARGLRVNVNDAAVARAEGLRLKSTRPQPDAVVQLWVTCSHTPFRAPFDAILEEAAPRIAAWLVTESEPIPNTEHRPEPGQRTYGWSQICFLQRPPRLTQEAWLGVWHGSHTKVAIETQSNFEYVQNTIVRPLTYAAPPYSAMIEECFPTDAMDQTEVFFDGQGDRARYEENARLMAESCARFIDFDKVDVVPTSQYMIRPPG
jgi:hypothetical protein